MGRIAAAPGSTPRTPLLQAQAAPGMSQRLSDESQASTESPQVAPVTPQMGPAPGPAPAPARGPMLIQPGRLPPRNASASASARFGPTANIMPRNGLPRFNQGNSAPKALGRLPSGPPTVPKSKAEEYDDLDDQLHTFTAADRDDLSSGFDLFSARGWANALTLLVMASALVGIFAVYPIVDYYFRDNSSSGGNTSGYNLGGINSTGQFPLIPGLRQVVDPDTPSDVMTRTGSDGNEWTLVFSDEFNQEGRTFFEGDDPYFTAVDLHYWPTDDLEWYDPSAVTTEGGAMKITITQEEINGLQFKSGMVQSWNQLCFNKNAYFEVSIQLPGSPDVTGFWPGVWTMGNLGRPGYGASTDGTWPYTYDSCDVGTLPNQTNVDGTGPSAALDSLSYLPGQRLSACTCSGEDHPGPSTNIGRNAPEIDVVEAGANPTNGYPLASQSFQVAPFDAGYEWDNSSSNYKFYDSDISELNSYKGGFFQEAVSTLTRVPNDAYRDGGAGFSMFGMEFQSNADDRSKGYITWYVDNKESWTLYGGGLGPNSDTQIGQRLVSEEPMALVFNLAISDSFSTVELADMTFPNYLLIDYIRVYQKQPEGTMGCDPADHPTADYISQHSEVYNNPNLTLWSDAGYSFPKNSLKDQC